MFILLNACFDSNEDKKVETIENLSYELTENVFLGGELYSYEDKTWKIDCIITIKKDGFEIICPINTEEVLLQNDDIYFNAEGTAVSGSKKRMEVIYGMENIEENSNFWMTISIKNRSLGKRAESKIYIDFSKWDSMYQESMKILNMEIPQIEMKNLMTYSNTNDNITTLNLEITDTDIKNIDIDYVITNAAFYLIDVSEGEVAEIAILWGDGTAEEKINSGDTGSSIYKWNVIRSHNYADNKNYQIKITATDINGKKGVKYFNSRENVKDTREISNILLSENSKIMNVKIPYRLPETALVYFNDGTTTESSIKWEADGLDLEIGADGYTVTVLNRGNYTLKGTVEVIINGEAKNGTVYYEIKKIEIEKAELLKSTESLIENVPYKLPETALVYFNDGTTTESSIFWNVTNSSISLDLDGYTITVLNSGEYTLNGVVTVNINGENDSIGVSFIIKDASLPENKEIKEILLSVNEADIKLNTSYILPEFAEISFNDGTTTTSSIKWNLNDAELILDNDGYTIRVLKAGTYTLTGVVEISINEKIEIRKVDFYIKGIELKTLTGVSLELDEADLKTNVPYNLPQYATAVFNDGTTTKSGISWNITTSSIRIDANGYTIKVLETGIYTIKGMTETETETGIETREVSFKMNVSELLVSISPSAIELSIDSISTEYDLSNVKMYIENKEYNVTLWSATVSGISITGAKAVFTEPGIYNIEAEYSDGIYLCKENLVINVINKREIITFADINLTNAVRKAVTQYLTSNTIKKSNLKRDITVNGYTGDLYKALTDNITNLEWVDKKGTTEEIIDLTDIEKLINLLNLNFSGNNISNLEPVGKLSGIKTIDLSYNNISDISPLTLLTPSSLNFNGNTLLSDISALSNKIEITELNIGNTGIGNNSIEIVKTLSNLKNIILDGNEDLTVISGLETLNSLEKISMENVILDISQKEIIEEISTKLENYCNDYCIEIKDEAFKRKVISALKIGSNDKILKSMAEKLYLLDLQNSGITSLEGINHFTNLTNLLLSNNNISDISMIAELKKLVILNIDNNKITDLTPLSLLENITDLNASYNNLKDKLPTLSSMSILRSLYLNDNTSLSDISGLKNMKKIQNLDLSRTNIYSNPENAIVIGELTGLLELKINNNKLNEVYIQNILGNLYSNSIKDGTEVPNLEIFEMRNNLYTGYINFDGFENLEKIDAAYNGITELDGTNFCMKIRYLYAENNNILNFVFLSDGYEYDIVEMNFANNANMEEFVISSAEMPYFKKLNLSGTAIQSLALNDCFVSLKEIDLSNLNSGECLWLKNHFTNISNFKPSILNFQNTLLYEPDTTLSWMLVDIPIDNIKTVDIRNTNLVEGGIFAFEILQHYGDTLIKDFDEDDLVVIWP